MRGEILLFKIGDLIVYGQTGVCDVTEHYEKLLQSHSCRSLVELTMSIYQKNLCSLGSLNRLRGNFY